MHKILLALTGAALSAAAVAFPVYADEASPARTNTTFGVTEGALTISAPPSADLGTAAEDANTLSGHLGTVKVTDLRSLPSASWTASVVSTDFTGSNPANVISASEVTYTPGSAATTGVGGTVVAGPGTDMSASQVAQKTGVPFTGNNTASWNPLITVDISGAAADSYSGVITHSVA